MDRHVAWIVVYELRAGFHLTRAGPFITEQLTPSDGSNVPYAYCP
ncbi:hypothetical protein [Mycobacterium sp.]